MTTALILPLLTIAALAVAVYRIFSFLRVDSALQPAPATDLATATTTWTSELPAPTVHAEMIRPRS